MDLKKRAEKLVIEIEQLKKDYALEDSEIDEGNLFDAVYRQNEVIKDLLAENERLRNPLRPIEECPEELKDGRLVLGFDKPYNDLKIMRWAKDCGNVGDFLWRYTDGYCGYEIFEPTHFMELPTIGGDHA